jgi:hypothetical protein
MLSRGLSMMVPQAAIQLSDAPVPQMAGACAIAGARQGNAQASTKAARRRLRRRGDPLPMLAPELFAPDRFRSQPQIDPRKAWKQRP